MESAWEEAPQLMSPWPMACFIINSTMPTYLNGKKLRPKSEERMGDVESPGYEIIQLE